LYQARNLGQAEGVSITQFMYASIADWFGKLKALHHVRARTARTDRDRAAAAPARAGRAIAGRG
jgi:hypothetical protein